jgi:hypothetical protein
MLYSCYIVEIRIIVGRNQNIMTFKKSLKYQKRVESEAINRGKTTQ